MENDFNRRSDAGPRKRDPERKKSMPEQFLHELLLNLEWMRLAEVIRDHANPPLFRSRTNKN